MLKKTTSVLCILIGIAIIIMGFGLSAESTNHAVDDNTYRYSASNYDLSSARFGADFYTEIYKGSDVIVDVLNDINKSVETVVKAENGIYQAIAQNVSAVDSLISAVFQVGKTIVIAIGAGVLAYGMNCAGDAFSDVILKKHPVETLPENVENIENNEENKQETETAAKCAEIEG